jgi:hypothetical protein
MAEKTVAPVVPQPDDFGTPIGEVAMRDNPAPFQEFPFGGVQVRWCEELLASERPGSPIVGDEAGAARQAPPDAGRLVGTYFRGRRLY